MVREIREDSTVQYSTVRTVQCTVIHHVRNRGVVHSAQAFNPDHVVLEPAFLATASGVVPNVPGVCIVLDWRVPLIQVQFRFNGTLNITRPEKTVQDATACKQYPTQCSSAWCRVI